MYPLNLFFSSRGRIGAGAFLLGVLVVAAVEFAVAITRSPYLMLATALLACIPLFCIFAKRLNDMGAPAWPAFIFVALEAFVAWLGFSYVISPNDGLNVAAPWEPDKHLAVRELGLIGMLCTFAVVAFVIWGAVGPRVSGDNTHGPEPAF
jgi:uncharacterized membrane protein YhaH (DUF805 family)